MQLLAVEQEKLLLLEYIGEQGLRLPKQLRGSLQRAPLYRTSPDAHSGSSKGPTVSSSVAQDVLRGKSPGHRSKYPSDRFIRMAKKMGATFSFGSNNFHDKPIDMSRCRKAIKAHGLEGKDLFVPGRTR